MVSGTWQCAKGANRLPLVIAGATFAESVAANRAARSGRVTQKRPWPDRTRWAV